MYFTFDLRNLHKSKFCLLSNSESKNSTQPIFSPFSMASLYVGYGLDINVQKYYAHFTTSTPWIKHCSGAQNLIIYVYDFIVQDVCNFQLFLLFSPLLTYIANGSSRIGSGVENSCSRRFFFVAQAGWTNNKNKQKKEEEQEATMKHKIIPSNRVKDFDNGGFRLASMNHQRARSLY